MPILLASFLLRVAEEEFTFAAEGWFLTPFAVWLGTFLFSLLFYPLQKKQKEGVRSLPLWAAVSAGVGLVGVALYGLENWAG